VFKLFPNLRNLLNEIDEDNFGIHTNQQETPPPPNDPPPNLDSQLVDINFVLSRVERPINDDQDYVVLEPTEPFVFQGEH
jgi:hypothetical protein